MPLKLSYLDKIDYWVSEPDSGIYNAMNKGINSSNGELLLFLNSGDFFINSNIIESCLPDLNGIDIWYGNLNIIEEKKTLVKKYDKTINFTYFLYDTLPHQSSP